MSGGTAERSNWEVRNCRNAGNDLYRQADRDRGRRGPPRDGNGLDRHTCRQGG